MTLRHLFQTLLIHTPLIIAIDKTANPDLSARLKLTTTTYDRLHVLDNDEAWTYDFTGAQPIDAFKPGSVKNANAATFPALTGLDMTLAQLNLGPCAMLPPHLHPRATNLVMGITGNTTSYMWNENGVRRVTVNLTPGVMTVFPKGTFFSCRLALSNACMGCDNAFLVSALNSDDTGTLNVLNGLWEMPPDMIRAAFGDADLNIDEMRPHIPGVSYGAAVGSAECLAKCNMNPDGTKKEKK
ncbi:hypothetical protein K458DRAFT_360575 [Lentithecium fluviatile CBS 122367]|uniref:Cupin type-1 domain-containing protein n=1 Tax=Lentithecium fluviatile CBS 122367 TaxID=1168545 RepID=A0A6G1JCE6_9PLEO|nr:hypothetical protein K458DRAFT_360575 [Lentithecium fluviatile CBS 122367]